MKPPFVRITETAPFRYQGKNRQLSPKEDEALRKWIQENEPIGNIRRSTARNTSPITFATKKDSEKLRVCIDYTIRNKTIQPFVHAPPAAHTLHNEITAQPFLAKIDLRNAFYHLKLHPESRPLCAFNCKYGVFEPVALPFGLCTAPGEFQHYLETIVLPRYLRRWYIIYLDDILIYGATAQETKKRERYVRAQLRKHGIEINEEKSHSVQRHTTFLGYEYHNGTVKPVQDLQTIQDWPRPRTQKALRAFLGLANRFAANTRKYAHIAAPLYEITGTHWTWEPRHNIAFERLKQAVANHIATTHHNPIGPATIYTDASNTAIGAYAMQHGHVTAIYSRKLNPSERNYDTTDRELLAIADFTERYVHLFSSASKIRAFTDNNNIVQGCKESRTNLRRNRDLIWISHLRIKFYHIRGTDNTAADVLSRKPRK